MIDPDNTLLSQYANSPRLTALLELFMEWVDPTADFSLFYSQVLDLKTATRYGLETWGRIVGISGVVQTRTTPLFFGFAEAGPYESAGFEETGAGGPFYDTVSPLVTPVTLDDDQFRLLILAKALYNITDGSIPSINRILMAIFGDDGNAWVSDDGNMVMTIHFDYILDIVAYGIVTTAGVMPKPAGVQLQIETPL